MNDNCWLPLLELFDDYENDWKKYEDALYNIFKQDFIDRQPVYMSKPVIIKRYPMEFGKEEAFFHTTCKDYVGSGERVPDFRRCERIRWIRAFIENYDCDSSKCESCEGVKVWCEPYKNRKRIHMLLPEERYIVVIEKRDGYYLLITSFYIEYDNALKKKIKHYEQFKNNGIC